jgi:hypothetical protein
MNFGANVEKTTTQIHRFLETMHNFYDKQGMAIQTNPYFRIKSVINYNL